MAPGRTTSRERPEGARTSQGESLLLTEFGDFQCPHCARFGLAVLPALERDLIEPGTVRFEYRHYPFLGPESFDAAEASECARDQGMFREYHDALLQLTAREERLTRERLVSTAGGLELDTVRFSLCLESGEKKRQGPGGPGVRAQPGSPGNADPLPGPEGGQVAQLRGPEGADTTGIQEDKAKERPQGP